MKPTVYIAMPCHDSIQVETCVSLLDAFDVLRTEGIKTRFKSVKSALVTLARNTLTCGFLDSGFDYMLFIDADTEFAPDAVMKMLTPGKDIVCTPCRLREGDPKNVRYAVKFKKRTVALPGNLIEIDEGGAGMILIKRVVFERLMDRHPELKIKFNQPTRERMNEEIGAMEDAVARYMYNFWDTSFSLKTGVWKGEDLSFSKLATDAGFKIYANPDSWITHHGSWGWRGRFKDVLDMPKKDWEEIQSDDAKKNAEFGDNA